MSLGGFSNNNNSSLLLGALHKFYEDPVISPLQRKKFKQREEKPLARVLAQSSCVKLGLWLERWLTVCLLCTVTHLPVGLDGEAGGGKGGLSPDCGGY